MGDKAKVAEAWGGLGLLRTAQAVYYLDNNTYADAIGDINFDDPADDIFAYTINAGNATNFKAFANGQGSEANIDVWITRNSRGYTVS